MELLRQNSKTSASVPASLIAKGPLPTPSRDKAADAPKRLRSAGGWFHGFLGWDLKQCSRLIVLVLTMLVALSLAAILLGCAGRFFRSGQICPPPPRNVETYPTTIAGEKQLMKDWKEVSEYRSELAELLLTVARSVGSLPDAHKQIQFVALDSSGEDDLRVLAEIADVENCSPMASNSVQSSEASDGPRAAPNRSRCAKGA